MKTGKIKIVSLERIKRTLEIEENSELVLLKDLCTEKNLYFAAFKKKEKVHKGLVVLKSGQKLSTEEYKKVKEETIAEKTKKDVQEIRSEAQKEELVTDPIIIEELARYKPYKLTKQETILNVRKYIMDGLTVEEAKNKVRLDVMRAYSKNYYTENKDDLKKKQEKVVESDMPKYDRIRKDMEEKYEAEPVEKPVKKFDDDITESYDEEEIVDSPTIKEELCKYRPPGNTKESTIKKVRAYIRKGVGVNEARSKVADENQKEATRRYFEKRQPGFGEEGAGKWNKKDTTRDDEYMKKAHNEEVSEEKPMCTLCFSNESQRGSDMCENCNEGMEQFDFKQPRPTRQ